MLNFLNINYPKPFTFQAWMVTFSFMGEYLPQFFASCCILPCDILSSDSEQFYRPIRYHQNADNTKNSISLNDLHIHKKICAQQFTIDQWNWPHNKTWWRTHLFCLCRWCIYFIAIKNCIKKITAENTSIWILVKCCTVFPPVLFRCFSN